MAEKKTTTRRKPAKTAAKTPAKTAKKATTKKTVSKVTPKEAKDTSISTKKARITREINRLRRLFADIDENKKKLVNATIKDVAFMTVAMEDLREEMIQTGLIEEYQNGPNQWGKKKSTASESYLQFSNKQTAAMKILVDALPKTEPKKQPDADDFDDFVYNRPEV